MSCALHPPLVELDQLRDIDIVADPNTERRPTSARTCRCCGCTDDDCSVCLALTGQACHWVTEYLCSACVEHAELLLRAYARIGNRSVSPGPIYRQAAANWRGNGPATVVIERAASVLREARPNASW